MTKWALLPEVLQRVCALKSCNAFCFLILGMWCREGPCFSCDQSGRSLDLSAVLCRVQCSVAFCDPAPGADVPRGFVLFVWAGRLCVVSCPFVIRLLWPSCGGVSCLSCGPGGCVCGFAPLRDPASGADVWWGSVALRAGCVGCGVPCPSVISPKQKHHSNPL